MKNGRNTRTKVTMRDVARLADVSQSTVSRVLSASSSPTAVPISEETAQRINDAVKQLGYYPNLTARALRGQKTHMIAMMIADIANPYYHFMVRRVQEVARQHNYDVLISISNHDKDNELHFVEAMMRRPVDGVIITPYHLTEKELGALIERTSVPVTVLSRRFAAIGVDGIYSDDGLAVYEATQWLIQKRKHKRIAFIGVPGTRPGDRRMQAFLKAMQEAGLPTPDNYQKAGDFGSEAGERAMRELMALPPRQRPTAVFASNDLMALGCIAVAQDLGLRVPEDVAVMGFDDIPEASRTRPRLTTVAQHPLEMGEKLAEALFERIEGKASGAARLFEVPCKLMMRESA
jgi:DNA-binding LacI/PurR family transcriptional regulator